MHTSHNYDAVHTTKCICIQLNINGYHTCGLYITSTIFDYMRPAFCWWKWLIEQNGTYYRYDGEYTLWYSSFILSLRIPIIDCYLALLGVYSWVEEWHRHTVPFNSIRQGMWPVTSLTKLWNNEFNRLGCDLWLTKISTEI